MPKHEPKELDENQVAQLHNILNGMKAKLAIVKFGSIHMSVDTMQGWARLIQQMLK